MSFVYQLYQQVCNNICVKHLTSTYAKFYTTDNVFQMHFLYCNTTTAFNERQWQYLPN